MATDRVEHTLPLPVERLYADPSARKDEGPVALQRGPMVYCVEGTDADMRLHQLTLPRHTPLTASVDSGLLGGISVVTGQASCTQHSGWKRALYRPTPPLTAEVELSAIPCALSDQYEPGEVRVRLREDASAK